MNTKKITNVNKQKYSGRLPGILMVLFGCLVLTLVSADSVSAQCQYNWQQKALGFDYWGSPSPEIKMTNEDKVRIAKSCDDLFKAFINNAGRPDPQYWGDAPLHCEELAPQGWTNVLSLDSPKYTQYYKPLKHPKSIERNLPEIQKWYSLFDCPTRQAIRLLEKKNIRIPSGLIVYRMPKPTANGDYQSPTIIARSGAWQPIAHIIIPEFYDREYTQYSTDLGFHGVILSSIGEIIHERAAGEFYYTLSARRPVNGAYVSPRARQSAYFFVADVFAGWVAGKRYPKAVWDEYFAYRGPRFFGMGN